MKVGPRGFSILLQIMRSKVIFHFHLVNSTPLETVRRSDFGSLQEQGGDGLVVVGWAGWVVLSGSRVLGCVERRTQDGVQTCPEWQNSMGVFVHNPKNPVKRGKSKDPSSFARTEFHLLWKNIEDKIKDIESSFYQDTLVAVQQFVQTSIQCYTNEIPAAVMQMGVNMPDHSCIFQKLNKLLKSDGSHTVVLDPKKCQNIPRMFQIINQEFCKQLNIKVVNSTSKHCSLNDQWKSKSIVFLIQDVEAFSEELLKEIILNSKIIVKSLPIVLIFGMTSAMVTFHTILPQKVLCCLKIETFQPFTATDYLTHIIQEAVISPLQPFKLGPRVLRLIVDTVLYHDFSVTNLSWLLQFCLFEHCFSNRAAVLCCPPAEVEERVNTLNKEELLFFKELPSVKMYLENNQENLKSISSNTAFKLLLVDLFHNLLQYQDCLLLSLRVFHCLTKDLPRSPLGKQFHNIYMLYLNPEDCSTKNLSKAENLLKFQSLNDLLSKLKACLIILNDRHCMDLFKMVKGSLELLSNLEEGDFKSHLQKTSHVQTHFNSRFELQQKIQSNILQKRSKFEILRNQIVDDLISYFKNLHSPLLLPLHEILFFDDVLALKKNLLPSPRVLLCSGLSNPQKYFQCRCCVIKQSEDISSSMPDVCILYKLHLPCGKLINLWDWLEEFKNLEGNKDKTHQIRVTSKRKPEDCSLTIRFLQTASELQLLGFTKLTKRKSDHVLRIIFGI